jgi:hypothetical protein
LAPTVQEYRLELMEAESSFVERFMERITNPHTGWGAKWAEFHGEPAVSEERHQS